MGAERFRGSLPSLGEPLGEVLTSETATGKGTPVLVPTLISPRSGMIILDERRGRGRITFYQNGDAFPVPFI